MKAPSLWMFAAGCFGPVICRTRAISLYRDVKRTATARARAKRIWPAIARFVVGCVLGAACELVFGDGVCASRVVIGPCCQRAAQY